MNKFVPRVKMSKKARKKLDAEKRTAGLFDSTIPPAACQREAMRKALRVCVK